MSLYANAVAAERAAKIARDMADHDAGIAELREVATLAYRALEDAYRVISTIDDDTHEQWELDLLSKLVKDAASSLFAVLRYPKVGAGDTPMARLFGCCADGEDKTALERPND